MLRLPPFTFRRPTTLDEACRILDGEGAANGGAVRVVAGGTDLWPNLKRRQESAATIVSLMGITEIEGVGDHRRHDGELRIGATTTIDRVAADAAVRERYPALADAAAGISTVALRNMGTLGGNLCLNTRCTYFGQSEEWRCSIDYCMKEKGTVCWVAPSSDRCWAISASDAAPVLAALGASVRLVSRGGERAVPVAELYRDDGIEWLTKRPDEVLAEILLPASSSGTRCRTAYRKLRRRGSIDFAALTVAAAVWTDGDGLVERASIYLGSVASCPLRAADAEAILVGRPLDAATIADAARAARATATPLDNADFTAQWRSRMVERWVTDTLCACS
ncbi:MAG TPA: FAD binding domain-containing protein [Thermoanaerobaculia bacterium]|jgi:4-hydroxybenzoyl-CoA reductase subunit beta|nr:FAD binding domain-containing protein [Thermoanaerobaculia bacterium]